MLKNKLISIILIVCLFIPKISLAEGEEFDYEHLISGSCVTKDGFFFTEDGMVKLVINTKEKIRLATLDGQRQIDLLTIDLQTCSEKKTIELRIQKEMFEKQLKIKQDVIDAYKVESYWSNIKIVGATVIGIATGALVVGLINLTSK